MSPLVFHPFGSAHHLSGFALSMTNVFESLSEALSEIAKEISGLGFIVNSLDDISVFLGEILRELKIK